MRATHGFMAGLTAVCLLATWQGLAGTYYVAQQDPKAADTNAGTADLPWKTIQRGLKGIQPGDTVYVKQGTYREYIILSSTPRDGCPAVPAGKSYGQMIAFAGWPGDEVIIKGSDVVTGWKPHKEKIWVTDSCPEPKLYTLLFCDGKRLQLIGDGGGSLVESIKGWGGTAEVWEGKKGAKLEDLEAGSYFYDRATKKLYVWLADGSDPSKHLMEASVRGGFDVQVDFARVSGFKILHGSASLSASYGIMEDCESSDAAWGGFGMYGKFNTILRCKFNRNGDTGISGAGRGHRFVNCETSYNNFLKISPGWHAGGV